MNKLTAMAMVTAGLIFTTGCASTPMPQTPKEYEIDFTIEVNGKVIERRHGIVREILK